MIDVAGQKGVNIDDSYMWVIYDTYVGYIICPTRYHTRRWGVRVLNIKKQTGS